jgi:hypothetical protein
VTAADSGTGRLHGQRLADGDPATSCGAGGQLERGSSTAAACHAPRAQRLDDLADDQIAVQEDDIDGEPHEEHVDRVGRPDEQAFTLVEAAAAEQAAHSGGRRVGDKAALAGNGPIGPSEQQVLVARAPSTHRRILLGQPCQRHPRTASQ